MKSFSEYLSEVVIRLGSGNDDKSKALMKDFHSETQEHPFHREARIYHGNTTVHLSKDGREVHLHDIQSHAPKTGAGTKALKSLTSLADKHGVKINLHAKAYSDRPEHVKSTHKLVKWYKKHGFEHDDLENDDPHGGSDMTYYPK